MRCEQQNVKNVLERDYSLFLDSRRTSLLPLGMTSQRNGKYLNGPWNIHRSTLAMTVFGNN